MKKITLFASILIICLSLTGCHKHVSSTVDCTDDKYCDECGELISEGVPHTPKNEATCTEASVCSVCSLAVEEAKGHTEDSPATCQKESVCTVCGEVAEERKEHKYSATLTKGTAGCEYCDSYMVYSGGKKVDIIPETEKSSHFNNNIDAYYAGSVLVCGDYGLEYFKLSENGNAAYAEAVSNFAEKYPNVNVTSLLIPKACAFYAPAGYENREENQRKFINSTYGMMSDKVKKADAMSELSAHMGEYTYYRADHHWTSLGAYYASRAYCQVNGITPRELYSYVTYTNTGYVGSLYTYSGNVASLKANPDYTVAHLPEAEHSMTYTADGVTYKGQVLRTTTNSYAGMFICGDQPFTHITTNNNTGRKLIIFKESYGNAFAPFMVDYYDDIIVIDIRKDTDSISKIISEYGITDALIINNVQGAGSLLSYLEGKLES